MKKIKRLLCALLALGLLASLAACGGGSSSSAPSSEASASESESAPVAEPSGEAPSGEATEIRIWATSGAEDDAYRTMLAAIDEALPEVTIKAEHYPYDELVSKLQVAPQVGDTPDIVVLDALRVAYFKDIGMIADIDSYVTDEIRNDTLQSVLDENTYDGKLYGVGQFDAGMSFWANKSMLEAAEIRIPTSYTEAWTRAEFEDALSKLKAGGLEYPLYIRQNSARTLYYTYMPILRSFGGDYLNRDTMLATGTMDSDATIEAIGYIGWLVEQGYVNPYVDYEDAFYGRKESAISLVGHWAYKDTVESLGDDAILVPLPDMGGGVFTCSGSTVWNMTTAAVDGGRADLAWKVLEAVVSPEHVKAVTDVNGGVPARISVLNENSDFAPGGHRYLYREQLEAGISYLRPLTSAHNTLYAAMQDVYSNVLLGEDAATELKGAAEACDVVIKENGWDKK